MAKKWAKIEVKNASDRRAVELAMSDPVTRASVLVVGHLLTLPTDRARARAIQYVTDELAERNEREESRP